MSELLEKILSKDNMNTAYKRVCSNKGAGGVDGVSVEELGVLWSSFFVTLVAKKYRLATMLPFVPRMVCDSR